MNTTPPHVVIFPLPLQGPVNCMLKLTELILTQTQTQTQTRTRTRTRTQDQHDILSVTFINTDYIHHHLALHSDAIARLGRFGQRFKFEVVSDGLGQEGTSLPQAGQISQLTVWLETQARAHGSGLREALTYGGWSVDGHGEEKRRVTCIVADGLYGFMVDVAKQIGVPLVYFETVSPCGLWTFLSLPNLVQAGQLPFQGDDLDEKITSVAGMEDYLRRRDLPSFCRSYDPNDNVIIQLILKEAECFAKAQGQILNTFDDLELPLLSHFRAHCPNLYNIGPLHLHYRTRLIQKQTHTSSFLLSTSNSLLEEDTRCFSWLDAQPPKSVIFVSIGSIAVMTRRQLVEFWHGLVNSETRFLWVRRPGSIIDQEDDKGSDGLEVPRDALQSSGPIYADGLSRSDQIALQVHNPGYVADETKARGFLVSWVPQEKVLSHRAIGGFLTHSGWNSTLESIVEGVPMICWPFFVDQQVNSRFVDHVWQVGLDMKDSCDRIVIEKMVRDLMGARRNELATKARELAKLAAQAVDVNGSSYCGLNRLIEDIQFMRLPIPK